MRLVRCGSILFDPKSVVAVDLYHRVSSDSKSDSVVVSIPGDTLIFHGASAEAVRKFFLSMPVSDLMHRYEAEAPEAEAANHSREEC